MLCVWWCVLVLVCAVVYVLRVCVVCALRVLMLWCAVRGRYVWCWCWCWCVVSLVCVGRLGLRVYRENPRMLNTCARFARTHGGVLDQHTGDVSNLHTGCLSLSLLSFSLSLVLSSFSLPSYVSRSLSLLSSLLSSLSAAMTMITRPVGSLSLSKHGSDLPECQSAWAVARLADHVRIMQETTVLA